LGSKKKWKKCIVEQIIDVGAGLIMPFFDEDTSMMYLAGKGDGNIRYFEVVAESPYIYYLDSFKSNKAQIGMASVPKYALDTSTCEVTRLLKLMPDSIVPLNFTVPRKSTLFQDDIYPDTKSNTPPLTSDEWLGGKDGDPIMINLNPKKNKDLKTKLTPTEFKTTQVKEQPKTSQSSNKISDPKTLTEQNEQFRTKIIELEKKSYEYEEEIRELKKTNSFS